MLFLPYGSGTLSEARTKNQILCSYGSYHFGKYKGLRSLFRRGGRPKHIFLILSQYHIHIVECYFIEGGVLGDYWKGRKWSFGVLLILYLGAAYGSIHFLKFIKLLIFGLCTLLQFTPTPPPPEFTLYVVSTLNIYSVCVCVCYTL